MNTVKNLAQEAIWSVPYLKHDFIYIYLKVIVYMFEILCLLRNNKNNTNVITFSSLRNQLAQ